MRPCTGFVSPITTERSRHLTQFADLGLSAPLLEMLTAEHYTMPTPIQAQAIPHILAGRDLLGIAQTGTGKTAAFALPILHRLDAHRRRAPRRGCRVLVLAPTRELASQIDDSVRTYGRGIGITSTVVFGGVGAMPQIRTMAGGVDVLVATPGRLLDHHAAGQHPPRWGGGDRPRRGRPDARHGLHRARPPHRCRHPGQAARRCCSRRPCRTTSASSPPACLGIRWK